MISMTGFGRGKAEAEGFYLTCDIRSVNHKYLDISIRLPRSLTIFDPLIREIIKQKISRGHVELFIQGSFQDVLFMKARVDHKLAASYLEQLSKLARKTDLEFSPDITFIAGLPGVVIPVETAEEGDNLKQLLIAAVNKALKNLLSTRRIEGEMIRKDISARIKSIQTFHQKLLLETPKAQSMSTDKMKNRIRELAKEASVEPLRLAQEVAWLATKMDISEELTRFKHHMQEMKKLMAVNEPMGRKLDFLIQEANRELTTISNKLQGLEISWLIVEMKTELERIREQVQNVE